VSVLGHEAVTFPVVERRLREMKRLLAAALLAATVLVTSACASGGVNDAAMTTHAAVISSQSIHIGQTRRFSHLRRGDNISCLGRADSISLNVPRPGVGATGLVTWDKRLLLRLDTAAAGRYTAQCKARRH
jgi:hypothetical protein